MSLYRDELEQCPRCGTELIDAGAARGCNTCTGLWIGIGDVQEMATQMQMPPEPVTLGTVEDRRAPLPCPSCKQPMRTVLLYQVPVDLCGKNHGVWFDANELALVLLRSVRKPS